VFATVYAGQSSHYKVYRSYEGGRSISVVS